MSIDQEKGVCQDQAHIMISAARYLGIPSRYVNGYMHKNRNDSEFQATHAWAELYINKLGWVGFDLQINVVLMRDIFEFHAA